MGVRGMNDDDENMRVEIGLRVSLDVLFTEVNNFQKFIINIVDYMYRVNAKL